MSGVLLFEPDADLRAIAVAALSDAGHSAVIVGDAAEARDAIAAEEVAVAVVDVTLHGEEGWGIVSESRSAGLPVTIYTVHSDDLTVVTRARDAGAALHEKTGNPLDLVKAVALLLTPVAAK